MSANITLYQIKTYTPGAANITLYQIKMYTLRSSQYYPLPDQNVHTPYLRSSQYYHLPDQCTPHANSTLYQIKVYTRPIPFKHSRSSQYLLYFLCSYQLIGYWGTDSST